MKHLRALEGAFKTFWQRNLSLNIYKVDPKEN